MDDPDPALQLAELDALAARLTGMLDRLAAIRVEVTDPDGLIRLTLGNDGRLLVLWIADDAPRQLSNLALETLLNEMIGAGNEAVAELHTEVIGSYAVT